MTPLHVTSAHTGKHLSKLLSAWTEITPNQDVEKFSKIYQWTQVQSKKTE